MKFAGSLVSPPQAFAAETSGPEPGVHIETWSARNLATQDEQDRELQRLRESGAKWVRVIALWSAFERDGKGRWTEPAFAVLDQQLARLEAAGIKVVLVAGPGTPLWASSDPDKLEHNAEGKTIWNRFRPERVEDYADFVQELASRVTPRGVNAFALWNEPDHPNGYWLPEPDAGAYSELLKASYPAIKSVNPEATVLIGGLVNNKYDFLQGIYDHGGGPYFDGVGNHLYPQYAPNLCPLDGSGKPSRHAVCGIARLSEVLERNGDATKPIWLTELGFSSCQCHYVEPIDEQRQASYLRQTYSWLAGQAQVPVALWFNLRNFRGVEGERSDLGGQFGLRRTDDSPKPAFSAFQEYAETRASGRVRLSISGPRVEERPSVLEVSGSTSAPQAFQVYLEQDGRACAPSADTQARRFGSRLLSERDVTAGSFSVSVPFTVETSGNYRLCAYLDRARTAMPSAMTSAPLTIADSPYRTCDPLRTRDESFAVFHIAVRGRSCWWARASLFIWRRDGARPGGGPAELSCAVSTDGSSRRHRCRGSYDRRLLFSTQRTGA